MMKLLKNLILVLLAAVSMLSAQSRLSEAISSERTVSKSAASPGEKSEITFTVFTGSEELYKINRLIEYDEPYPSIQVFDNGSALLTYSFDGRVEVFDEDGLLVNEIKLFKEAAPDYERSIYSSVSGNLTAMAVNGSATDGCEVILLTREGDFVNRFDIEVDFISGVLISDERSITAVSAYSWKEDSLVEEIIIYSLGGELNGSLNGQFNHAELAGNMLFGFTNKKYFSVDLRDLSKVATGVASADEIVLDMLARDGKIYVAVSGFPDLKDGKWHYRGAVLHVLNRSLSEEKVIELPSLEFTQFSLGIEGSKVTAITEREHYSVE